MAYRTTAHGTNAFLLEDPSDALLSWSFVQATYQDGLPYVEITRSRYGRPVDGIILPCNGWQHAFRYMTNTSPKQRIAFTCSTGDSCMVQVGREGGYLHFNAVAVPTELEADVLDILVRLGVQQQTVQLPQPQGQEPLTDLLFLPRG